MLLSTLRKALRQAGDPGRASAMQAYMKSAMPYHGVPTPLLRQVCKATFVDLQFATAAHWQEQVLSLWRAARFREERYAALYLTSDKRAQPFQTLSAVKMYEELIVTGAWWDYVDDIASHRIGADPEGPSRAHATQDAVLEQVEQSVEAAHVNHLPAWLQGRDGSGTAVRLHRTLGWIAGILSAEGDRLGTSSVRLD
jgi:hypothetical protein